MNDGLTIPLDEAVLVTRPFTTEDWAGYHPLDAILIQGKRHTLRRQRWKPGLYEVSIDGRRRGIIIRVTDRESIPQSEFLTDEFARADGVLGTEKLSPAEALAEMLEGYYGAVPEQMWLIHFQVVFERRAGQWYIGAG